MDYCTAYIAIKGDTGHTVVRGEDRPLSYPEIGLLQFIHGEEAVSNVEFLREEKTNASSEKARLLNIYGAVVEEVYAGRNPGMEMSMPGREAKAHDPKAKKGHKGTLDLPRASDDDSED